MNWLLWKEYRVNRPIVYFTLLLLVFPHAIAIYGILRYGHHGVNWREVLSTASFWSLILSQLGLALIGGNAIAGERADRSAEFQAYLPLPRGRILTGKLLLALAVAAVVWITNPLILCSLAEPMEHGLRFPWQCMPSLLQAFGYTAITSLIIFCVAWLCSSFLGSPTYSVAAGLIAPLLVSTGLFSIGYFMYQMPDAQWLAFFEAYYRGVCLVVAPVCFAAGLGFILRRVEP